VIERDGNAQEKGGMKKQVCVDELKKVNTVGMYGDDERVKDGTRKGILGA
jgi:hypothetical protein